MKHYYFEMLCLQTLGLNFEIILKGLHYLFKVNSCFCEAVYLKGALKSLLCHQMTLPDSKTRETQADKVFFPVNGPFVPSWSG